MLWTGEGQWCPRRTPRDVRNASSSSPAGQWQPRAGWHGLRFHRRPWQGAFRRAERNLSTPKCFASEWAHGENKNMTKRTHSNRTGAIKNAVFEVHPTANRRHSHTVRHFQSTSDLLTRPACVCLNPGDLGLGNELCSIFCLRLPWRVRPPKTRRPHLALRRDPPSSLCQQVALAIRPATCAASRPG